MTKQASETCCKRHSCIVTLAKRQAEISMIEGIGIDLVEVDRIRQALQRRGERFLRKVLTASEIEYCCRPTLKVHSIAARFAAKEALFKSLPEHLQQQIGWQDVQVVNDSSGKPFIQIAKQKSVLFAPFRLHLSLSHGRDTAAAMVVCERRGGEA